MKKYENAKKWVEEVETVLNKLMKDEGIKEDDLTAGPLSTEIINKWVKQDGDWKKERVVLYDFVEDTQTNLESENDYRNLDSYKKFFIYKYKNEKSKPDWSVLDQIEDKQYKENAEQFQKDAKKYHIGDPDSTSILLQKIYELLWGKLTNESFMHKEQNKEDWICSDTMTSAMARFTDTMGKNYFYF